jgi:hypothetical protein
MMAERRSLVEGVKETNPPYDPVKAREFIAGAKSGGGGITAAPALATSNLPRSPFSTRIRTDFTTALKRASLERQLKGVEPNTLVDILEQAIEPWLKSNGYLSDR